VARPFPFERTFDLAVDAPTVWRVLERTNDYPKWWSWLESFRADGLRPGTVDAVIRSPLGYRLCVEIAVQEVVPGRLLVTEVRGDLRGPARLELMPNGARARARLQWELELCQPLLRRVAVARPLMVWAHDRIVDRALLDFRQHALPV
jgi:uncharacterized protein YndB with AHSA1/START domain